MRQHSLIYHLYFPGKNPGKLKKKEKENSVRSNTVLVNGGYDIKIQVSVMFKISDLNYDPALAQKNKYVWTQVIKKTIYK